MEYIPFICIYLNHFYIWNFFYITASTVSVFIYFQRSLFPFFIFACYYCIILHAIIQFELKRLKKLVTQKYAFPTVKSALILSVVLSFYRNIELMFGGWKLETLDMAQTGPRISKHEYLS